ncbi:MAG: glycosyltransferase [Candidatus Cloacimonetes bacterium]|nr:glycosyltransferase [Candidatus Cloacimonadota bacterium]MDD2649716.1 glycosyltransferase [Candidatus Cloacimonadota bacterium]MDD3500805.1 glycosyltransferase [Candidatus Cloacimonadota bacterium]
MQQKILIITNSHRPDDSRVYQKIAKSLAKKYQILILYSHIIDVDNENNIEFVNLKSNDKIVFKTKALDIIYDHKPQLIICVEPYTLLIGNIALKKHNIPFIYDCHEFFAEAFADRFKIGKYTLEKIYSITEMFLYKKAAGVITVNDILVEKMRKHNTNTIACANFPDYSVLELEATNKEYDLIYIGGISQAKGLQLMLELVHYAIEQSFTLNLLILGTYLSEKEEQLAYDLVRKLDIKAFVTIKKTVPSNDVYLYIKKAKIGLSLLNPNTKRYQKAIPLKLLEYMKEGLPVVANNFPIVSKVVTENNAGFCVDFDVEMTFNAVKKLLSDEELYLRYSQNAKMTIKEKYNWQNEEKKLLLLVDRVINE